MRRRTVFLQKLLLAFILVTAVTIAGCSSAASHKTAALPKAEVKTEASNATADNTGNWPGALAPEKALKYMQDHYKEGLVIVEVNTDYWKLKTGFKGAMHIPHTEMAARYNEIPAGKPVILHCGAGVVSVDAYKILQEKRKDIPQLSYIAGAPPVAEFNEWLKDRGK